LQVSEIVGHILHHVVAEVQSSDPSQASGMAGRSRLIRRVLGHYLTDTREISIEDLFQELIDNVPGVAGAVSLRRALLSIKTDGDTRPQLAIQDWVGKAKEKRGG
jgi:hypothetical protein